MTTATTASNVTAPTRLLQVGSTTYAYRRFGEGPGLPLLCLQHFTGTLDNWDPAVTDPLASGREVILFDNAGVGRSTGRVPATIAEMTSHALAFLDGLGLTRCDLLGYSLGGMIAQQMALDRSSIVRRMILVGTAPRGGEDVMHLEKPVLAKHFQDPTLQGYAIHDEMIPAINSYWLAENLPNAVLLLYPDSGHGSLFQFHESFTRQAAAFLESSTPFAPY